MDLGDAAARSLAEARQEAARLRAMLAKDIDPIHHAKEERKRQQRV